MFQLPSDRVFIIAELSANHNGSLEVALETVKAAKRAGADAIKLQTYTADTITLKCDQPDFKIEGGTLWDGKTLYELYGEAYTPWEWHKSLFEEAKVNDLICFSTPFDFSAVDFLETFSTNTSTVFPMNSSLLNQACFCCKSTISCNLRALVSSETSSSILRPANVPGRSEYEYIYPKLYFTYSIKLKVS